jgi:hypothetical protein
MHLSRFRPVGVCAADRHSPNPAAQAASERLYETIQRQAAGGVYNQDFTNHSPVPNTGGTSAVHVISFGFLCHKNKKAERTRPRLKIGIDAYKGVEFLDFARTIDFKNVREG